MNKQSARWIPLLTGMMAVPLMYGCGGDSGPSGVSQLVTRAAGGTVNFGSGGSLTIPPNSLAADTTITVQSAGSLPAAPASTVVVNGTAFEFGPTGTTFSPAATLVIHYGSLPGNVSASSLSIFTVVGGNWQAVGGTVNAGAQTVTVPIAHFTPYAILGTVSQPTLNPTDFAGHWAGQWHNTTFGSQSTATLDATVNSQAKTMAMTFQINGNVLGTFNNPPAEQYNGTYDNTHFTLSGNSNIFGAMTITVDNTGHLTGHMDTTNNARVASLDLTGTVDSQTMTMNYTVHFRDNTSAVGTFNLSHQ